MNVKTLENWELVWLERQCRMMGDIEWADKFNAEYKLRTGAKTPAPYVGGKGHYEGKRLLTPKEIKRLNAAKKASKKATKKKR